MYAHEVTDHSDRQAVEKTGKGRSVVLSTACWVLALLGVVYSAVSWSPVLAVGAAAEGELGRWFWSLDVLASLAGFGAYALVLVCLLAAFLRRFVSAGVLAVAFALLVVLPMSEPRLERAAGVSGEVRVLVYNSHTFSNEIDEKHTMLTGAGVDVAVVIETSTQMMSSLMMGEGFRETHPYGWLPDAKWSGCPAVMSRFPVEPEGSDLSDRLRSVRRDLWDHLCRLEIVHSPGGSFALIQAHARSPRNSRRWSVGLDQLLDLADSARRVEELTELPVVVAGDFNSPPTSVRARAFATRSGLIRAKPATKPGGSFPSAVPAFMGLAIDGVYASPGVKVTSWDVVGSAGSDHRGVVIGIVLPGG